MSDIRKLWPFLITESWRNRATRFGDSFTSGNRLPNKWDWNRNSTS
jgi:hypothetical protein